MPGAVLARTLAENDEASLKVFVSRTEFARIDKSSQAYVPRGALSPTEIREERAAKRGNEWRRPFANRKGRERGQNIRFCSERLLWHRRIGFRIPGDFSPPVGHYKLSAVFSPEGRDFAGRREVDYSPSGWGRSGVMGCESGRELVGTGS